MLLLILALMTPATAADVVLKPVRTYEELPGDSDLFLQGPGDVCLDKQGRLHVFDHIGKTLMVWDKDGKYVGNYGKPGEGPGELTVMGRAGGPQGYVTAIDDTIYVYDGGSRRLNRFNMDLSFRSAKPFQIEGGRVEEFRPLPGGKVVVFYSSYFSEQPFRKVAIYDEGRTNELELARVKDETWHYIETNGSRRVELYAFSAQLHLAINQSSDSLILADSHNPGFEIYDLKGNKKKTVTSKLIRRDVTRELIQEFNERPLMTQSNGFFTAKFPDKQAYYDRVLAVGTNRFLVFLSSPVLNNLDGYLIDDQGQNLGRFKLALGEGGGLFSSFGRIFGSITNEEGDFSLIEYEVRPVGGAHPGSR